MKSLLEKLKENKKTPYHMPGHKRCGIAEGLPYDIDITEIDGFDNLHDMNGVLKDVAERAASLYKSNFSFPLVNGSTCGVLAGIYSLTRENKNILIARNCHKSVYNAVEILELNPTYIMPEVTNIGIMGRITPQSVEEALRQGDIGTVVITSPTYEGIVSDIDAIYDVCLRYGARLFVDAAHGAHFIDKSVKCDLCVMSLHKTLPSLTQTALLHIYSDRVDYDMVKHALSVFETSSPSYVLMASIDECLRYVNNNKKDFDLLKCALTYFYDKASSLSNIKVTSFDDESKIVIISKDGYLLSEKLREQNIEPEMASANYVLAMSTIADTVDDLEILLSALFEIDKTLPPYEEDKESVPKIPEKKDSSGAGEFLDISGCCGKISKEYIWAYPPGIPIITPGEVIDKEVIKYLKTKKDLKSTKGKFPEIYVKKD